MAKDLANRIENFSLTKEEDWEIKIQHVDMQEVVLYGKNGIVGKLIADWLVSKEAIKTTLFAMV
jgi:hypothetical protein